MPIATSQSGYPTILLADLSRAANVHGRHVIRRVDTVARVTMRDATAWRLFFRALPREEARRKVTLDERADIGAAVFAGAAVMV